MMKIKNPIHRSTNFEKHTTKNPVGKLFLNNFLNTVVKTIRPLNIDSVLDVGCGEGFTLARLQKEKIGKEFEGIEADEAAIELGKKLYPRLKITKGDIYKLPYKSNSFDLVVCTEVLEHLENPKKAYRELIRVSNKYILISVPNEPFFTWQRIARFQNILHLGAHPEHIQHWTLFAFTKFVHVRGVKLVVRKFPIPWTMVVVKKVKV
ncbi:MAG: Methylase involved in ubiquinone/menaquinone biosynthesis [Microgenomates group bacterium GW2011_GWA2_37_6]|nr:MAG: Methylase involved in ubiquinone/menaquinone biosynthesis [Microgenomates group bacterium GW2011_GWA2_37_6]